MVISVENQKFYRSRMMKRASPLNLSQKILLHRQISLNFETDEISHFSRYRVSGDTWHEHVNAAWHPRRVTHGMSHVVHLCEWLILIQVASGSNKARKENKEKFRNYENDKWHGGKWGEVSSTC